MRTTGKILVGVVVVLVTIAVAAFFSLGFYLSPQSHLSKSDAIVAISGGETTTRAEEAISLYKQGWASHLIFSGAALDPKSPSNAKAMAQLAESKGVPKSAISLDETSTDTAENAAGVAKIVAAKKFQQIILVTSPYHQRRAYLLFSYALGDRVQILNHSSIDHNWRRSRWWANSYSREATLAELQKTAYVIFMHHSHMA